MGGKLIRECRGLAQNCFIFEIVWLLVKRKYQKPRVFNKKKKEEINDERKKTNETWEMTKAGAPESIKNVY